MWACAFCGKGVFKQQRTERISFRQSSDKGYVRCQVAVMVFVCDACGTRSLEPLRSWTLPFGESTPNYVKLIASRNFSWSRASAGASR